MLSIIIPTLSEQDSLPALLKSIKEQEFGDYQIIIADAGSKDRTLQIAKDYGALIVPGGLPAKGRNSGAQVASGEILLFLDADVVLPSTFLAKSVAEFEKRNLGVAGFLIKTLDGGAIDRLIYRGLDLFATVNQAWYRHAACAIMTKSFVHNSIGGFNEKITLLEDYYYAKSASKVSRYGYIRQPFFVSMRRYKKDGRKTYLKYALATCYTIFFGPITSGIFNYKFNHYKTKK